MSSEKEITNLGENLVQLRINKRISQEELADELKISRQAVSKWEQGSTKPDVDNLLKISKYFKVGMDDLMTNDVIKREAYSISVKNDDKTEQRLQIFKLIRYIVLFFFLIFIIVITYKFVLYFKIVNTAKQYKELSNYHYIIYQYEEGKLMQKEECWFKDGVSKTIQNVYNDNNDETLIYIDYNESKGYQVDKKSNNRVEINMEEHLLFNDNYEKGGQLYSRFPDQIKINNVMSILSGCIKGTGMYMKINHNKAYLSLNESMTELQKYTLLPDVNYTIRKSDGVLEAKKYEIELDSVENIKI